MRGRRSIPPLLLVGLLVAGSSARGGDPAAAERQYRVARRLAAEGSPEAAAALQKVVELDPTGELADDAIVEEALLLGPARWPEELGRLDEPTVRRILALLTPVADGATPGDRSAEARFLRGLARLEPLSGYDATAARFDLISVATSPDRSEWVPAARYAGAWLAERLDRADRAEAAYQRVLVDAPRSGAALRARVALGRLLLRDGRAGRAAALLQNALDDGASPELGAEGSRELALRIVLSDAGAPRSPAPEVALAGTGIRGEAGIARIGGLLLVGDAKSGSVAAYDRTGSVPHRWSLDDLQAVSANRAGWIFAAAGDGVYRLRPDEPPIAAGSLGDLTPVSAMTADRGGRVWVVDRRGERVARLDPGARVPAVIWESSDSRLVAIAWDGRRLVAADARRRTLITIAPSGRAEPFPVDGLQKPALLASDEAGRLAVVDGKDDLLFIVEPAGRVAARIDLRSAGANRPAALAFAADGALQLFDGATGNWVIFP